MNRGAWGLFSGLAVVASAIAILAGADLAIAVPAAAAAVIVAGFLLYGIVEQTRWPEGRPLPSAGVDPARIRSSLGAGVRGRASLIGLLDTLERTGGYPTDHVVPPEVVARLEALSPEEFRAYLASRLSILEHQT